MFRTLLDGINPVHPRRPKIGLAWTGGLPNTGRTRRSLTLDNLAPLIAEFPQADFVSLQYMDAPEAAAAGVHHFPFATQTKDYMDTAALVAELDLVITVQTAVVHLAGALGKACHVIVSNRPVWRYGAEGAAMPWYSSVVLHRQPAGGTWQVPIDSVIATVGRAIRNGDYLRKLPAAAGQAA
jgi:ADP-heptose:LPS heptosyltransferase